MSNKTKLKEIHKEEVFIDGIHEYDYVKDDEDVDITIHTLYYSNYPEWSDHIKNTIALQLINTGNGIIIKNLSTKKEIDYLQIEQLHILLRLQSDNSLFEIAEPVTKTTF